MSECESGDLKEGRGGQPEVGAIRVGYRNLYRGSDLLNMHIYHIKLIVNFETLESYLSQPQTTSINLTIFHSVFTTRTSNSLIIKNRNKK